MAWWDHVTETPEASRMAVFNIGTLKGSRAWTSTGGQMWPRSWVGAREEWKKAQKNEKKKHTSETMNRIIPICKPVRVCIG